MPVDVAPLGAPEGRLQPQYDATQEQAVLDARPCQDRCVRVIEVVIEPGRPIEQFGSVGAHHLGNVRFAGDGGWALLSLGPGSHLGRHRALLDQLFVVLDGSGWVAGDDGTRTPLQAGQAALWTAGEEHESGSTDGMRVAVLEATAIVVP